MLRAFRFSTPFLLLLTMLVVCRAVQIFYELFETYMVRRSCRISGFLGADSSSTTRPFNAFLLDIDLDTLEPRRDRICNPSPPHRKAQLRTRRHR